LAFLKDSINIKGGRDYAIEYIKNNILGRQLLEVGYGPQI